MVPLSAPVFLLLVYFGGNAASVYSILSACKEEQDGDRLVLTRSVSRRVGLPERLASVPAGGASFACAVFPAGCCSSVPVSLCLLISKTSPVLLLRDFVCPYFCCCAGLHRSFLAEVLYGGLAEQVMT